MELSREEEVALRRPPTSSPVAYQLYLKARVATYRYEPASWRRAVDLFELALEADPSFASAHAGLAATYGIGSGTFLPAVEATGKAREAVAEALRLDDSLPEAHVTLGMLRFWADWDLAGAEESMRRGLALAPNDAVAHHLFSWQLAARGRFPEAEAELERAADLDPTSAAIAVDRGLPANFDRRPEEALRHFRRGAVLEPASWYGRYREGLALLAAGRALDARRALLAAERLCGGAIPEARVAVGIARAPCGETDAAEAVLREAGAAPGAGGSPNELATLALALGRRSEALDLLERALAVRDKWLMWCAVDPRFDPLRGDGRFERIRAATGLG